MSLSIRALSALLALIAAGLAPSTQAHAATAYQGIYVIVDPYSKETVNLLQQAAETSCASSQAQSVTPFCGATSGILVRVPWCDFQLYHQTGPGGAQSPSCHYTLQYSNGAGSPGVQTTLGDQVSPCAGTYDTCAGSTRSVLGAALRDIVQIDNQRAAAGMAPLQLSVGMFAGIGTPQTLLDTVGYVDVATNNTPNSPSTQVCYRLPLAWKAQFITAYEQANDQLIDYIVGQLPPPANIVILKPAPITSSDLELVMPGQLTAAAAPTDPGPAGPGPLLNCQYTTPAATIWLDAYNADPNPDENFSQANESAFGAVIGHLWATAQTQGLTTAILSIPITNNLEFANVDCGVTGAATCAVGTAAQGDWSIFYFQKYVQDLFSNGLAYTQAASAYAATRTDTFSLAPNQLAINSTALTPAAIASASQVSCEMNNTQAANAPVETLNQSHVQVLGVGSLVGWQTTPEQGGLCAAGTYGQALANGINDAGQYLEVQTDAAFTDIAQCSPYLTSALSQIISASSTATCTY